MHSLSPAPLNAPSPDVPQSADSRGLQQPRASRWEQDWGALRYSLRTALRGNRWLLAVPLFITLIVTIAQLRWHTELSTTLQVTTGEIMGSLLAGFLGANMLDGELRLRAGELIFTKPYPIWRLVLGRVGLILLAALFLVGINSGALALFRHLHWAGAALAATVAPALFLCALACALFVASSNITLAYIGPALFWIWSAIGASNDTRLDRMYNPLFQISAWSGYLNNPSPDMLETLRANNLALILTAFLLFGWCCRRARTASLVSG